MDKSAPDLWDYTHWSCAKRLKLKPRNFKMPHSMKTWRNEYFVYYSSRYIVLKKCFFLKISSELALPNGKDDWQQIIDFGALVFGTLWRSFTFSLTVHKFNLLNRETFLTDVINTAWGHATCWTFFIFSVNTHRRGRADAGLLPELRPGPCYCLLDVHSCVTATNLSARTLVSFFFFFTASLNGV